MSETTIGILKYHNLWITKPRVLILDSFLQSGGFLDVQYFLKAFPEEFDRITVFRTLKLFTEKRIIYRVPSADRFARYLLQTASSEPVKINQSSFICKVCGEVTLLDTIIAPKVRLPKGFKKETLEVVVSGLCKTCIR